MKKLLLVLGWVAGAATAQTQMIGQAKRNLRLPHELDSLDAVDQRSRALLLDPRRNRPPPGLAGGRTRRPKRDVQRRSPGRKEAH